MKSLAERITEDISLLDFFTEDEKEELKYNYRFWARESQLEPDDYFTWLILSGRGFGKTWVGSHWTIEKAKKYPGCHIALIGESSADIRDVMVENGESAIVKQSSPNFYPKYEASKRRLTFPNGSVATLYSADKPELLRGPQHHFIWMDELAKYYDSYSVYDMALFGLRLGNNPKLLITTTPKPLQLLKDIIKDTKTVVTSGSTYENRANLSPVFLDVIRQKYDGTNLGQQELYGVLLEESEGALWTRELINSNRKELPKQFDRIVIGVDVAITNTEDSDETGIIVCGQIGDHGYIIDDLSGKMSPSEMAKKVINAYWDYSADRVVLEVNQGGDFLTETIRLVEKSMSNQMPMHIKKTWASKSKKIIAGIIQPLYEQKRAHHCKVFSKLEDQMCNWIPGDNESPDRLDALVWALTELFIKNLVTEQYNNTVW